MIWSGWRSETRLLHQHTLLWCRAATLRINGRVVEEEGESLVLASKSNVAETESPHPTPTLKSVHTSYGFAGKRMFREGWGKEKNTNISGNNSNDIVTSLVSHNNTMRGRPRQHKYETFHKPKARRMSVTPTALCLPHAATFTRSVLHEMKTRPVC